MSGSVQNRLTPWMRAVLLLAGTYNLIWGLFILYFPDQFYSWLLETRAEGAKLVDYQGVGVLIFGFLYLLSSLYPVRFWYLIFIGLLSKTFGAVGVYFFIMNQSLTDHFIFHLLINDFAWLIPLAIIAQRAFWLRNMHTYEKAA